MQDRRIVVLRCLGVLFWCVVFVGVCVIVLLSYLSIQTATSNMHGDVVGERRNRLEPKIHSFTFRS